MLAVLFFAIVLAIYPRIAAGYSFAINNTPQQCQNLNISIVGSGQPPYSALILPFGPSPLANNVEVRQVLDVPFNADSTSLSFQLPYPENSQFVVVVSDGSGFGTGGTSTAALVQTGSSDSSCYSNTEASPPFTFSITTSNGGNGLVQCSPIRLWWDPTQTQGNVQFYGAIPGGQSFTLNQGAFSTVTGEGYGFNWGVPIRESTTLLLIGGDSRGIGTAGWTQQNVQQGENGVNNTCLTSTSPSSTPGSPAGGAYPTSSSTGGGGSGSGSGSNNNGNGGSGSNGGNGGNKDASSKSPTNLGAIVGASVGGGVALIAVFLACLCFIRRRRSQNSRPVNLLQDDGDVFGPGQEALSPYYRPEAFPVSNPPAMSSYGRLSYDPHQSMQSSATTSLLRPGPSMSPPYGHQGYDPRQPIQANTTTSLLQDPHMSPPYTHQNYDPRQSIQTTTTTSLLPSGTPEPQGLSVGSSSSSSVARKGPLGPAPLRPVNIIQHDDGGDVAEPSQLPETIELPPAYNNIRSSLA